MSLPVFARLCGLFTLVAVVYVLFALDMFPGAAHRMGLHYDPESVRVFAQENVSPDRIRAYLEHITSYDHVAGTEGDYSVLVRNALTPSGVMSNEVPLLVEYEITNNSYLRFYLAPKIGDEE